MTTFLACGWRTYMERDGRGKTPVFNTLEELKINFQETINH